MIIMPVPITKPKTPWSFILIGGFSVILFFVLGRFYYIREKSLYTSEQNQLITSIATTKTDEIIKWIEERKHEGIFLKRSIMFTEISEKLLQNPGNELYREDVRGWICPIRENHKYQGILLFSAERKLLAGCGDLFMPHSDEWNEIVAGCRQDSVFITDLIGKTDSSSLFLDITVLLNSKKGDGIYVIFRIDPLSQLYPIFTSWPLSNYPADISLIRTDEDKSVSIYWQKGQLKPVIEPIPDDQQRQIAMKRIRSGSIDWYESRERDGKKTFTFIKKVAGTNWSLSILVTQDNLYRPVEKSIIKIITYLLIFSLFVIIIVFLIWKNQQLKFYRNQLQFKTAQAKSEEKIRFMNALLQEVNDAIITFDKDQIIQSWNKGAERIYGWKAEEVVGKYGGGSLRVDFPGATRENIFKELEQRGYWKGEVVHKKKDGSTAYLLSSTSQLKDEEGNVLGIITINKDITAVIHSEKIKSAVYRISELAHYTKDLDDLFASIHVVIGELMDARNLYIAMLEHDQRSISFPYFIDEKNTSPGTIPFGNGLTEYVVRTGKPFLAKPEDTRYFTNHGIIEFTGTPPIDWLGVPLKSEQETFGVLAVQSYSLKVRYGERERDILIFVSEQIALSIQRKKIQQELIEAKQKAEVSSKLTSSLLANMNHELRTPMNGILGFAEILLNEVTDPNVQAKVENILISGRRLMDTLDAIMDLSYLESDKVSRKFRPVNVTKCLRNILNVYEPMIRRKNLELVQKIPSDLTILGDEQLYTHALRNLIDNALKYTEEGSITISGEVIERNGQKSVSVNIADTGIGIAPENHEMIFEAFRQVSEGYGRHFEGSGLGLTLTKKISFMMNGNISMTSEIGKGSVFTIEIPMYEKKDVPSIDIVPEIKPFAPVSIIAEPRQVSRLNILVVEDNVVNLKLLMFYLKDKCNVFTALDAKTAIRMTYQRKFDVILMDINLGPGMDGIQAMLEIRKQPEYQGVPIIAVTGYASIGDRDRLINIGFSGYLSKPFDRELVLSVFEETNLF